MYDYLPRHRGASSVRNPRLRSLLAALCLFTIVAGVFFAGFGAERADAATPAKAPRFVQVEQADRPVMHRRVTYVEHMSRGRLYVELNNGATFRFPSCHYEDSRNCWWDAETRGTRTGHSFVNLRGHVLYLDGKTHGRHGLGG